MQNFKPLTFQLLRTSVVTDRHSRQMNEKDSISKDVRIPNKNHHYKTLQDLEMTMAIYRMPDRDQTVSKLNKK